MTDDVEQMVCVYCGEPITQSDIDAGKATWGYPCDMPRLPKYLTYTHVDCMVNSIANEDGHSSFEVQE